MATYRKHSGGWRVEIFKKDVQESQTFPTKMLARAWATLREATTLQFLCQNDTMLRERNMKKHVLFFMTTVLGYTSSIAQMPIPLLEEDRTVDYEQWQKIMPFMQAGLECRNYINPEFSLLNAVFTSNTIG